jgi:hypothetical protein
MPFPDSPPPQQLRLSIGRPLVGFELHGRALPTDPTDGHNRCDFHWQNTPENRALYGLPDGDDGMVFLCGVDLWIGASLNLVADLLAQIHVQDSEETRPRWIASHVWDRYARSNGNHSNYKSFAPNYFEIPNNAWFALWSLGTTVEGAHGFHHGVCGLYFAKERP